MLLFALSIGAFVGVFFYSGAIADALKSVLDETWMGLYLAAFLVEMLRLVLALVVTWLVAVAARFHQVRVSMIKKDKPAFPKAALVGVENSGPLVVGVLAVADLERMLVAAVADTPAVVVVAMSTTVVVVVVMPTQAILMAL